MTTDGAEWVPQSRMDNAMVKAMVRAVLRSDLYRLHMTGTGAALPRASDKVEGILGQTEQVPATQGSLSLLRNRFFDGAVFDPNAPNR